MGIISSEKAGSGSFEPIPEGTHLARCVTVVDLGVQETPWGDKKQVYLGFEVPGFEVEWEVNGEPKKGPGLIGVTWTNNLYEESNLGRNLISWRGKPFTPEERKAFDLTKLLGVPCMISVSHATTKAGRTFAKITSIVGVPVGVDVPTQVTESVAYSPQDPGLAGNLEKLPQWLQDKASDGMTEMQNPVPFDDEFDADLPF